MAGTEFADLVKAFADRFGTGPVHDQSFMVELYRQLADGKPVRREALAAALDIQIEDVAAVLSDFRPRPIYRASGAWARPVPNLTTGREQLGEWGDRALVV